MSKLVAFALYTCALVIHMSEIICFSYVDCMGVQRSENILFLLYTLVVQMSEKICFSYM